MLSPASPGYVDLIVEVAARDASIARVLREICSLDGAARGAALDLLAAHLGPRPGMGDVLACIEALRREEVARRIAEALGRPG